ncbi:MAG: hypothetical protein HGB15_09115 [Chlorobaculum sp.]|nr:hypothetical protein [Chlorobaculum sp.]
MENSIPVFTVDGVLPSGVHRCSGEQFLDRFCEGDNVREAYYKALTDIFDFARNRKAKYVFVGGSFITDKKIPSDIDIVIVFPKKELIPTKGERLLIEGKRADIMFCSEDEPSIVDAFIYLFSHGRYGYEVGIIQVDLLGYDCIWEIRHMPEDEQLEIVKRVYFDRELFDLDEPQGVLVTVHGLLTNASWNSEVIPIFSSQGWVVAPFDYGYKTPTLLFNDGERKKVLNDFREWIYDIQKTYCSGGSNISVIAHSFGTYIIGAYLNGFSDISPVTFDCIILTGSILSENYDWNSCIGKKVGRVRNEMAPNDQWVKWMPKNKWMGLDSLFGRSGVDGFKEHGKILTECSNSIYDHNNVIRKDVINQMWLPYLNANKGAMLREYIQMSKKII